MATCSACGADVLDIDVKCPTCGKPINSSGAYRMLGTVVLGQYELVDVLGQGGMSVVFKGRHKLTDQGVALKILPPELAAHAQVKGRFLEEAKALAQLDHPNIVHLYNFGQEAGGSFVLAMQLVAGKTWERMILEHGRLDWVTSARITLDVLRALEYAHHRGIVHRDMKPSNVLIRDDDSSATVMDFGIAKMTTSTRLTATGQTMGTVRYMSPEQVRGQEVDARTDLYSLGATLYESLVGDTPFDGDTHFEIMTRHLNDPPVRPSARGVSVSPVLEDALMRSLAKKADDRFATARDFRKEVEAALKDAEVRNDETLRMSRDAMAQARTRSGAVGRRRAESAIPVSAEASSTSPESSGGTRATPPRTTAGGAGADPQAANMSAVRDLASSLEPTGSQLALGRRRSWIWLALGGAVALAAGGVLAVTMLGRPASTAAATPDSAAAPPATFEPHDVTWTATGRYDEQLLTVRTAVPWDPAEVAKVHRTVSARWGRFLAARGVAPARPLAMTVMVVPPRVFCDPRTYERDVPGKCQDTGNYYRPVEQTLLVVGDRARLELNLANGVADATCVHDAAPGACDAVNAFVAEVAHGGS